MYCFRATTRRSPAGAESRLGSERANAGQTCCKFCDFMNQAILDKIESEQYRKNAAEFGVGDTVRVHTKVVEGDKERIQIFSGVVIGRRGHGINETFTVRRISYGEGVERVFPVHSPRVEKVEVERKGSVRRAKLTYLRKRLGKGATLVKEREGRGAPGVAPVEEKIQPAVPVTEQVAGE